MVDFRLLYWREYSLFSVWGWRGKLLDYCIGGSSIRGGVLGGWVGRGELYCIGGLSGVVVD